MNTSPGRGMLQCGQLALDDDWLPVLGNPIAMGTFRTITWPLYILGDDHFCASRSQPLQYSSILLQRRLLLLHSCPLPWYN